jgi:phosphatidylserine/phosphatidylglycerophosphate/cardiolipin synthase-like enzyme
MRDLRRVARLASLGLILLSGLISGCRAGAGLGQGATPTVEPAAWYQVYFTDPAAPGASNYRGGPEADLAAAIDQARLSVEAAFDTLDLWSLRDALIAAHRRGVTVRVVVESDNLDVDEIQDLLAAGIPVLGDRREGMMHDKFVILDRQEVWTGSMNFTVRGAYRSDNNLQRMRSPLLAEDYLAEFEEMFTDDLFGPGSPANTPHPRFQEQGTELEVYFSPDDGVAGQIVRLIRGAQQEIAFLAFSFTSDQIAAALVERMEHGVSVSGVFDASQVRANTGTEFERLREAGAQVRLDGGPGSMHHKVIIIDDSIVITGSYNFSRSAEERNDENTLVIHDPAIARLYIKEFVRVFEQGR